MADEYADSTTGGIGLQIFHEEDGSPNLFALYSGDLGEHVMSYASLSDVGKIETLSKQYQGLVAPVWERVAYERFGMRNGKDGYRMGTSLLTEPVFIHIDSDPIHGGMYYAGSPHATTHNSLVAVVSDDQRGMDEEDAPIGIGLYDAQNLTYLGPREGGGWNTTMAGPAGNELFVTNMDTQLTFSRGDITHRQQFPNNRNRDGMQVIACETHVIVVTGNTVILYSVTSDDMLVALRQSTLLGGGCRSYTSSIAWGADQSEFIIYHSHNNIVAVDSNEAADGISGTCEISVWSFDVEAHSIARTQTIEAGVQLKDVALSEDFIVGSSADKKIHVWDRHTEVKKPFVLCDINEEEDEEELDRLECIHSVRMSCHGHMLVSTSHFGCAICVWNIKTGQLLERYNDAEEERRVDMLPDGCDVTSMAYLKQLNAYICTVGYLNIWTFPTNQTQHDTAVMIRNREEDLRQNAYNSTCTSGSESSTSWIFRLE